MWKIQSHVGKIGKVRVSKISLKILVFVLVGIVSITAVFSYMSDRVIRSVYNDFFNDKTLLINRIVASQIEGDDLLSYIDALRRDREFQKRQIEFYQARQKLIELEETETDDQGEKAAAEEQIRLFYQEAAKFKDANYFRIQKQLDELCAVSDVKYLYIFADTGVPGMYTYIFDARASRDSDATSSGAISMKIDADDIGTVDVIEEFAGADSVFATKRQLSHAEYEAHQLYGVLYFTYAPLFDSAGNVVAVVGTDIDLSEMNRQIETMAKVNLATALIGSCLFILLFYPILRRVIVKPIVALRETASRIADGHIYTDVPAWLSGRNDEMGLLGKALSDMTQVFQHMLTDTRQLFEAAIAGRLDVRNDPSSFKGDVARVVRQINDTLDIVGIYFDSMPEALFILDPRLELVFKNKRASRLFDGLGVADIVRRVLSAENSDTAELTAKWNEALRSGFHTASAWLTTPEAETCFAFTCCDLILNGIKRGTLVIAADITDLMREKARAQSANEAKDDFLSRVSHELRSPMNIIIGMAKLGLKELKSESKNSDETASRAVERLESIVSASDHLLSIINDMLDMSHIEAGEVEIKRARFDLREVVADCCNLLKPQAEEKRIDFTYRVSPDIDANVLGDVSRVSQVLVHLLTNAVKFTEEGGRVTLLALPVEQEGEKGAFSKVSFSVEDTGIGMSEEFMEKIFVPFEQEDQYIQRRHQGVGLGLSICHRLVALMGGVITAVSTPGVGSVFTFTLPLPRVAESEPIGGADSPEETGDLVYDFSGVRMLLVDDIELNRTILREILADTRIDVTEASDGAEALKLFEESEEGHFHIVFMDVQMPNMDGYQATDAIRALNRKDAAVPVMAMTANAMRKDVEQALAHGMNGHLSKPIDIDACLRAIADAVTR
ncbi:MAG: response regulator [Synergistaceae bacterium]|jgi:signal transduction histidine kinase/ActR/RegA family two-component response regulator|nr:response regulator [Synergistaceae bacterium]